MAESKRKLSLILGAKDRLSSVLVGCANKSDAAFNKLKKRIENVASGFDKLGGKARKAGSILIASTAAAVTGTVKLAQTVAAAGDRIDKTSQKIGMSRQAFQQWDYVMSQNGSSVEVLEQGFRTLTTQVDLANKGNKDTVKTFNSLGISIKNANGQLLSQEEIFNKSVKAVQNLQNPTQKAITAQKLFGRAALEMKPLLNQSAQSVDELKQKAKNLGMIIDDKTVDSCVKLTDTFDTLKRAIGGIGMQLGGELLPVIRQTADKIIANLPAIKKELLPVLTNIVKGLGYFTTHLSGAAVKTGAVVFGLGVLSSAIGKTLSFVTTFGTAVRTVSTFMHTWRFAAEIKTLSSIAGGIRAIGAAIMGSAPLMIAIGIGLALLIKYHKPIMQFISGVFSGLNEALTPAFNALKNALKPLSPVFNALKTGLAAVFGWFVKLFKPVSTTSNAAYNAGKSFGLVTGKILELALKAGIFIAKWSPLGILLRTIWTALKGISSAASLAGKALQKVKYRNNKNNLDGSHANGLDYVPFDGYTAELHKGERILTADENRKLVKNNNEKINIVFSPTINADSNTNIPELKSMIQEQCTRLISQIEERTRRRTAGAYA